MRWKRVKGSSSDGDGYGGGPGKRWGHTFNSIREGKLLYLFGGYGRDNCQTNQVHVFDTLSQSWSQPVIKGTPPTPRDSHTCTTVGDNLFVFGGTDGVNPLRDLHILDTSLNIWITPSVSGEVPEPREGHTAALIGKRLFIFGGCGKSKFSADGVYYNDLYILNTETFIWTCSVTSGTPPSPRDSHTCSSWGNKMIVIGGEDRNDYYLCDVHVLDTDTLVWKELDVSGHSLPPRAGHSAVSFDKYLLVFGGFSDEQNLYDDLYMLDLDTCNWTKIYATGDGPSARFSMAGDCLDPTVSGALAFIGGCNKSLEALDDMYFLYTDLVREFGRDERRLEKLSLRKQLKMKCQERYIPALSNDKALVPFGSPDLHEPVANSQHGLQYFHLNDYQPKMGKRTFHAKVTKNLANGYTIETVIDGKPLHGILFSDKPLSSLTPSRNLNGEADAAKFEVKLNGHQEPKTDILTTKDPQVDATTDNLTTKDPQVDTTTASVGTELGSSAPEKSAEVVTGTSVPVKDPIMNLQNHKADEAFDPNQISENISTVPEGASIPTSQGEKDGEEEVAAEQNTMPSSETH